MYLRKTLILGVLFIFSACSSLEEIRCNSSYAAKEAYSDVENGRLDSPGLRKGEVCKEGYTYTSYRKDYQAALVEAKREFCTTDKAAQYGAKDAESFDENQSSLSKLKVCLADNGYKAGLTKAYEAAFRKSLCQEKTVMGFAQQDADKWDDLRTDLPGVFAACTKGERRSLYRSYVAGYQDALADKCSPIEVTTMAIKDARKEAPLTRNLTKLKMCPARNRTELLGLYRSSYNEESIKMNNEKQLALQKEQIKQQREMIDQLTTGSDYNAAPVIGDWETFYVGRERTKVRCQIRGRDAEVVVKNASSHSIDLSGTWNVEFYNKNGRKIGREQTKRHYFRVPGKDSGAFKYYSVPNKTKDCRSYLSKRG